MVPRPAAEPQDPGYDDLEVLLSRAVRYAVATDEVLVVKARLGRAHRTVLPVRANAGLAPTASVRIEPPLPMDSGFWWPHLPELGECAVLSAPATRN